MKVRKLELQLPFIASGSYVLVLTKVTNLKPNSLASNVVQCSSNVHLLVKKRRKFLSGGVKSDVAYFFDVENR